MKLQELIHRLKTEYEKWGDIPVIMDIPSGGVAPFVVDTWPTAFGESVQVVITGELSEENRPRTILESIFNEAINEECSCGGKGPEDEGVCPACMVSHRVYHRYDDKEASNGKG